MAVLVRKLRKERGLTQQQLSEAAAISRSYISEIETGEKHPNTRRLEQLARALGVHPADLLVQDGEDSGIRQFIRMFLSLDPEQQDRAFQHLTDLMRDAHEINGS